MNRTLLAGLLASTAVFTLPAQAQDELDLGTIVFSGGLTPVESSAYGRSASVLEAEDIEERGLSYVSDVLRALPGVSVSRTGSFGGLTQIRIRGNEANHTLVLIDGVEVAAPNSGEFDFGGLLAADIERIEVLRGPQSSIYGSNAIGGVISITTKSATEPGLRGEVGVEVVSDGSYEARVAARLKAERGDLSFSAARRQTGGFDISGTPGGEDDGDNNETYNLKGQYHVTDTLTVGGSLRYTERVSDTDAFNFGAPTRAGLVTDDTSNVEVQETFGLAFAQLDLLDGRLRNRLEFSFSNIDAQGRDGTGADNADNTGTRTKLAYRTSYALDNASVDSANQIVTFAADWEYETFEGNQFFFGPGELIERNREQYGLVLEYQGSFENGFDVQASVRHDFNDDFEDFTSYALGASYRLPNQTTRVHASYGTGVQNPTLIEQFGFFANFAGNPNLEPEQSEGWDIGIEQQFWDGRGVIDVTYFDQELTDEITSVFDLSTGISTPINQTGTSDRRGVEVTASVAVTDRFDVGLNYTWLDAENPDGSIEIRRAEHEALLQLGYTLPNDRTRFTADVQYVSGLFDSDFTSPSFGSDQVELDDYTLVHLGMTHDLTDRVRLYGAVRNALDENYEELDGYATQGRTVAFGVTAKF